MFGVVKGVDDHRGEIIYIKTFIRADKFDVGGQHEKIHKGLERDQFDNVPELQNKSD
jgi:hypothetical protein